MASGWIGVDLDGTLAHYDGFKGKNVIGAPVMPMLRRVKNWIARGQTVRIFTARAAEGDPAVTKAIQDWCEANGLPRLSVTCVKDTHMTRLYDDRAVQVRHNTGEIIG